MTRNLSEVSRWLDIFAKKCESSGGRARKDGMYVSCRIGDVLVEYDASENRLVISGSKGYVDTYLDLSDLGNLNFAKLASE